MRVLFHSPLCSDCRALFASEDFAERFGDCEQVNITESMANLRRFLAARDHLEGYAGVRESGMVGVPSVVEDGEKVTVLK